MEKMDYKEIKEILLNNEETAHLLTIQVFGEPENIIREHRKEAKHILTARQVLKEREIFFKETLKQLNRIYLPTKEGL